MPAVTASHCLRRRHRDGVEPDKLLGANARRGSLSAFVISVALSRPGSVSMISFAQKDHMDFTNLVQTV